MQKTPKKHLQAADKQTTDNANSHATLRRIAEMADTSVSTVSRALSGQARRYRISKQTELAVQKLAKELNFVPNHLAQGLRLKKTRTVGLIIPDISDPFFAHIAHQVAIGTRKHGYSVVLCDSQDSEEFENELLALLRSQHVAGIVLCPVGQSSEHLAEFAQAGLPMVLLDRIFPELPFAFVGSDSLEGAKTATNYFIENGHRRIACIRGARETTPNKQCVAGYKEALKNHHLTVDESLIVGDSFGERSGYIETKLLLRTRRDVTAILALSNLIGLGAIRALTEEGKKIPDDVSIISFDEQPYSAYLATPLTTVAQRNSEMGEIGVKLLLDQIDSPGSRVKGGILLPTSLIVRQSVKKLVLKI